VLHTANPADIMFSVVPSLWSKVGNDSLPNKVLLGCFLLHYFNRSIVYPIRMDMAGSSKPMPLAVMLMAWFFCLWNGSNQALNLIIASSSSYTVDYLRDWKFILGLSIFFTGMCINIHSDSILLALKNKPKSDSSTSTSEVANSNTNKSHYRIPRGGLFEYVSCANFCKPFLILLSLFTCKHFDNLFTCMRFLILLLFPSILFLFCCCLLSSLLPSSVPFVLPLEKSVGRFLRSFCRVLKSCCGVLRSCCRDFEKLLRGF
jgi:hypothetical protein